MESTRRHWLLGLFACFSGLACGLWRAPSGEKPVSLSRSSTAWPHGERTTFAFEKTGRITESCRYDGAGALLERTVYVYPEARPQGLLCFDPPRERWVYNGAGKLVGKHREESPHVTTTTYIYTEAPSILGDDART